MALAERGPGVDLFVICFLFSFLFFFISFEVQSFLAFHQEGGLSIEIFYYCDIFGILCLLTN